MNTQNVDYKTLNVEELEEYAEFVDWSLVPLHLLTEDIKVKFGTIPKLAARIWFEDLLSQMVIKEDKTEFPDRIFFFIKNKCPMNLGLTNWSVWCSHEDIWSIFENKFRYNYNETQLFIKNVLEQYFKDKGIMRWYENAYHLKDKEITPFENTSPNQSAIDNHFKEKKLIPSIALSNSGSRTSLNHLAEDYFQKKK